MKNNTHITINNSLHRGTRLLCKEWSERSRRALAKIGHAVKTETYRRYLQGQELRFNPILRDRKNRRTISYSFNRSVTAVKIESYPLNLFERGRRLRSGKREPGHFILTKKMVGYATAIANKIFKEEYGDVQR